jgi:hypothetical protein
MEAQELISPRINYIIGAWGGTRRRMGEELSKDRTYHIKEHIGRLSELKNSITHITIVNAETRNTPNSYNDYLNSLTSGVARRFDGVTIPVTLLSNPKNFAGPYGSWFIGYQKTPKSFTHYLFFEDDYVPCSDDYDSKMIDCMDDKKCDYLCAITRKKRWGTHAGLASGLVKANAMKGAFKHLLGSIKSSENMTFATVRRSREYEQMQWFQYEWSKAFNKSGFSINDVSGHYEVRFAYVSGKKILFFEDIIHQSSPLLIECL